MARLHDIMIQLEVQVGAISAQRSVARTVVTENRKRPVRSTNRARKKRSNPTPKPGGGNGGDQKPLTTMHGTGDPDPDDGDDDEDHEGQELKGGPSCGEKPSGRAGPNSETGYHVEDVIDVMGKAIARE